MKPPLFVTRLHRLTASLHAALIIALFALVAGRGTKAHLLLAALAVLPLLAPLPGLLRQKAYTAGWACMLVAFYAAFLLAEAYMLPSIKGALIALSVVAALDFVALVLYAKARKHTMRLAGEA